MNLLCQCHKPVRLVIPIDHFSKSERDISASRLIGLPLETLVLNNQPPSGEHGAAYSRSCEAHHDNECREETRRLVSAEEVWGSDVSTMPDHVYLNICR